MRGMEVWLGVLAVAVVLALGLAVLLGWLWWGASEECVRLRVEGEALRAEVTRVQGEAETVRAEAAARAQSLEEARVKLGEEFRLLSQDVLAANAQSFLQLAKGELEEKRRSVAETIRPVGEQLEKFAAQVHQLEKERHGAYSELRQQITGLAETQKHLQSETANLVKALRAPQTRGQWGEITLRRVVELAGMVDKCDFSEQVTVQGEQGRLRPDLLVHLPGGKTIVVDAKVAIDAYLNALEAPDEGSRKVLLQQHARQVRDHVERLARKDYSAQFEDTPELVVMFLPLETAFAAAVEQDLGILDWAAERKVILAAPLTLIALLRAVHYGWRQEKLGEEARKIGTLGRELHDRIVVFAGHFAKMGKSLQDSTKSYNDAVGSLERMVLSKARELKTAGAASGDKEVPEIKELELAVRTGRLVGAETENEEVPTTGEEA
jgi:DNA recombination protein RmuC